MFQAKKELDSLNSDLEDKKIHIKNLEDTLYSKQEELRTFNSKQNKLEEEIRKLRQDNSDLEKNLESTKVMMISGQKSLNTYLKKEEESRNAQINTYFSQIQELKSKQGAFKQENDNLKLEKQKLEDEIKEIKREREGKSLSDLPNSIQQKDDLEEKNRRLELALIEQKNKYKELEQSNSHTVDNFRVNQTSENKKLDIKLRSFIPDFFMKLFTKSGIEEGKIDDYMMELMDEKLSLLDLLQKAESFIKKENI